jgi:hypothetical protein
MQLFAVTEGEDTPQEHWGMLKKKLDEKGLGG